MVGFIPVNEPNITNADVESVLSTLKAGWVSSEGPVVTEFEKKLAEYHDKKYAVLLSSGTAALEICGSIFSWSKEDEIILPDHTIISCLLPVYRSGARPVFVDSDIDTWNVNLADIIANISEKTKAIIVPHLYGLPVDLTELEKICNENDIILIEDCAELMGGLVHERKCGSFGDCSILSFYANKQICTGEGGALLTNCGEIYSKARYYRNLCFEKRRFVHNDFGSNFRMTSLQAALGLSQLKNINNSLIKRNLIAEIYFEYLGDLPNLRLPLPEHNHLKNIFWVFGLIFDDHQNDFIIEKLNIEGIGARPFFSQLSKQKAVSKTWGNNKEYPNSEILSNHGLYLPSGLGTDLKLIEIAAKKARKLFESLVI
jgi:perosamine synthetase